MAGRVTKDGLTEAYESWLDKTKQRPHNRPIDWKIVGDIGVAEIDGKPVSIKCNVMPNDGIAECLVVAYKQSSYVVVSAHHFK